VENAIRPSAIGKKNWLFIGHPTPASAPRSSTRSSSPASGEKIDPLVYLGDVLRRLPTMTTRDDLDALTPAHWSPPEQLRTCSMGTFATSRMASS